MSWDHSSVNSLLCLTFFSFPWKTENFESTHTYTYHPTIQIGWINDTNRIKNALIGIEIDWNKSTIHYHSCSASQQTRANRLEGTSSEINEHCYRVWIECTAIKTNNCATAIDFREIGKRSGGEENEVERKGKGTVKVVKRREMTIRKLTQ